MEYIYAALLLHNAGKAITEDAITAVLQAAGIEVNESRVKALVAALEGVDIEEAIAKAAFAAPAAGAVRPVPGPSRPPARPSRRPARSSRLSPQSRPPSSLNARAA